ncbi:MAG: ABC transporter permease [Candidatus Margulisbacteria bacterium]|jgi:phospholipid/cholesterol/gamma-HCH transport system permease protein|nr:ABC transporter permease [Candidatus Margulisiibacteriota bacterium]
MPYRKVTENVGDQTILLVEGLGRVVMLAQETIRGIMAGKARFKLTLEQMVKIGYESIPLALVASGFVGMVFAMQIATEFVRFGAGKYVGGVMAIAMARELGPALVGIVIAARVSAAIAAELGTMQVTEQIDALKALGSNPVRYLVIPRFIASALMLPLLTVGAIVTGFTGGYFVAVLVGHINPVEYLETARSLLKLWDIFGGLIKTFCFGMVIAVVACYKGLNAAGGAKGVGEATTSSVVTSLLSLFALNYFLSLAFFK